MLVNSHVNGLPTYTMGYIGVNPLTLLKMNMLNPEMKVWKVIFRVPAVNFRRTSVPGISLSSWSKKKHDQALSFHCPGGQEDGAFTICTHKGRLESWKADGRCPSRITTTSWWFHSDIFVIFHPGSLGKKMNPLF